MQSSSCRWRQTTPGRTGGSYTNTSGPTGPTRQTLERMEYLDRLIESWQTGEPAEAEVEVVPMPLTLEAAAD